MRERGDAEGPEALAGPGEPSDAAFGAALRGHRRAVGLTQEALAERAGVGVRTLQGLEAGTSAPLRATARRLADGLGLPEAARARFLAAATPPLRATRATAGPRGGLRLVPPPPARPGPGPPGNLPAELSSFVGREREVAAVGAALAGEPSGPRLVTLTGPGGVGKTRLALRVAAELRAAYPEGIWLAELGALADPALVPRAVAAATGVREEPGRPLLATLADALRARRLLLVLDNCEHLLDACARLADALLRACPHLTVLATGREALGIAGETVWPVPALPVPAAGTPLAPDPAALTRYAAVRLFAERAAAVRPGFALTAENAVAVAEICARLDGIPLALELAAARVRVLPPPQLLGRLEDRFTLLTGGNRTALERHQTLRAAVDWSYALLSEPERALFARLAVFAGGWTLEAAEAVGAGEAGEGGEAGEVLDLLTRLADQSLVAAEEHPDGTARYRLLETLRQYAQERLEAAGAGPAVRARHAAHFLALAERAQPEHYGRAQIAWLDRVEREHDNLRAALRWLVDAGDAARGTRLATALRRFWWVRGHTGEARAWTAALVDLARSDEGRGGDGPATLARALTGAALFAYLQGDHAALGPLAGEAAARCRRLGDRGTLAEALHLLGHRYLDPGTDRAAARALFEESAAQYRAVGDDWGLGWSLHCLATSVWELGDAAAAWRANEESARLLRAVGDDNMAAHPLGTLGALAFDRGERARGRALLEESVALFRASGDRRYLAVELCRSGDLASEAGDAGAADRAYREGLTVAAELGARNQLASALEGLAILAAAQAQAERALRLAGAAAALREATGQPRRRADGSAAARPRLEGALADARSSLGPAAPGAWQHGRRMTTEQAVAAALAAPAGAGPARLTRREQEVVALLAHGWSNRQIAAQLAIAEGTARIHVERILGKLGLRSRAQVAAWAVQHPELCLSTDAPAAPPP